MNASIFADFLGEKFGCFFGVPDSLLKALNYEISIKFKDRFFVNANEGAAVAQACGFWLCNKKLACVYMQNSGLGNAINPLLSLADPMVYGIPLFLIIGLRGGENDEPQHRKMGERTCDILKACDISYEILSDDFSSACKQVNKLYDIALKENKAVALVVKKGVLHSDSIESKKTIYNKDSIESKSNFIESEISREFAISEIINIFSNSYFIATTGFAARELYELRQKQNQVHCSDFLCVGAMGFASSIGASIAAFGNFKENERVVVLDGDGAFLMHSGAMADFGILKSKFISDSIESKNKTKSARFLHIVLNNFVHDSVGGMPTNAHNCDFCVIAKGFGYELVKKANDLDSIKNALLEIKQSSAKMAFLEIQVKHGSRADLGRPKDIKKLKDDFCEKIVNN